MSKMMKCKICEEVFESDSPEELDFDDLFDTCEDCQDYEDFLDEDEDDE